MQVRRAVTTREPLPSPFPLVAFEDVGLDMSRSRYVARCFDLYGTGQQGAEGVSEVC